MWAFAQGDQQGDGEASGGWNTEPPFRRHQAEDKITAWNGWKTEPFQGISWDQWGRPESELLCSIETYKDGAKRKSLPPSAFGHVWWSQTVHRSRRTGALESNFPSKTLNRSFWWISCRWCEEKSRKLDLQKKSARGVWKKMMTFRI